MPSKHALIATLKRIVLIAVWLIISGCETTPPTPPLTSEPVPVQDDPAMELLSAAAAAEPQTAASLYLQAGWALLDNFDLSQAIFAYQQLEPAWLSQSDLPSYHLMTARIALAEDDIPGAEAALVRLSPDYLSTPRALQILSLKCAVDGDFVCAANLLIDAAADNAATSPGARSHAGTATVHNEQIWRFMDSASGFLALRERDRAETGPRQAWWVLYAEMLTAFSVADQQQRLKAWLTAHPQHPAALALPAPLATLADYQTSSQHIALLLPLSGPLKSAGTAIRDGFISAMLTAREGDRIRISIFDSAAEPLPLLYEKVLSGNVDLLVGPLQKDLVSQLNSLDPQVPTLALNYLEDDEPPAAGLHQLGLAIEDEAHTIGDRLTADGRSRVLVFHNFEDWSTRARRTLARDTDMAMTFQAFTDVRTVTEAVGEAMHVAGSIERRDELDSVFGGELEFLPRARTDMDAVVALVNNVEANSLVPALRFHFADHLPVYASSQVARQNRPGQLAELNGFNVSELPWFIDGDPLFKTVRLPFALDNNPFASLFALGADAFRVAERSPLIRYTAPAMPAAAADIDTATGETDIASPATDEATIQAVRSQLNAGLNDAETIRFIRMLGSTGMLSMDETGRISRELTWGRVIDGRLLRPEI